MSDSKKDAAAPDGRVAALAARLGRMMETVKADRLAKSLADGETTCAE
jgi:hypothetical protein